MKQEIDDYDLIDLDHEEFIRRGMEWLQWEAEQVKEER